jgi:hypothetical protein
VGFRVSDGERNSCLNRELNFGLSANNNNDNNNNNSNLIVTINYDPQVALHIVARCSLASTECIRGHDKAAKIIDPPTALEYNLQRGNIQRHSYLPHSILEKELYWK